MSETPCAVCGAHPRVHRVTPTGKHSRGHEYLPATAPIEATCGRCGREARLWPDGLVCPVCSKVTEARG